MLRDYGTGYELSSTGEILVLPEAGLDQLLEEMLPAFDPENVEGRVTEAINKWRTSRSSVGDKREAVRALVDVLEFLRPQLTSVLSSKDESDLFNLANNYGIRHHNRAQRNEYEEDIWLPWMFYFYLATIHVVVGLLARADRSPTAG